MSCDPNQLLADAKCFQCKITGNMLAAVELVVLCAIRDATPISVTPEDLITQAACFECLTPGEMAAIKVLLMCQIVGA